MAGGRDPCLLLTHSSVPDGRAFGERFISSPFRQKLIAIGRQDFFIEQILTDSSFDAQQM